LTLIVYRVMVAYSLCFLCVSYRYVNLKLFGSFLFLYYFFFLILLGIVQIFSFFTEPSDVVALHDTQTLHSCHHHFFCVLFFFFFFLFFFFNSSWYCSNSFVVQRTQ